MASRALTTRTIAENSYDFPRVLHSIVCKAYRAICWFMATNMTHFEGQEDTVARLLRGAMAKLGSVESDSQEGYKHFKEYNQGKAGDRKTLLKDFRKTLLNEFCANLDNCLQETFSGAEYESIVANMNMCN